MAFVLESVLFRPYIMAFVVESVLFRAYIMALEKVECNLIVLCLSEKWTRKAVEMSCREKKEISSGRFQMSRWKREC